MRKLSLALFGLVALVALVGYAPVAQAGTVDFFCVSTSIDPTTTTPCTNGLVLSAGVWSTTGGAAGVQVFNITGQYAASQAFSLVFSTSGPITIKENGGANDVLTGTISGFVAGTTTFMNTTFNTLTMTVAWTNLPAAVCAANGASGGCAGLGTFTEVTFLIDGSGQVAHVLLTPVPEVGSLAMFGSGLAMLGGFLRRKLLPRG